MQSTNASSDGAYEFPNLLIGSYTVTVEREGFKKYVGKGVRVAASQVADATVKLELGEASVVVEVNSAGDPRFPGGGLKSLPTYLSASQIPATLPVTSQRLSDFQNFLAQGLFQPYSADGFFGVLTDEAPVGQSIYHAGSVDTIHRFAHGLYLRGNYTFAKTIDDATNELNSSTINPRRRLDARNISADRGRSALDFTHKVAVSWVYDLPNVRVGNSFVGGFVHGWEVSGSYLFESGQPVTLLNGSDATANGSGTADRPVFNAAGTSNVPSGINFVCVDGAGNTSVQGSATGCGGAANVAGYVAANPASKYVKAGLGTNTNIIGRDTINTPGLNLWNIALLKSTKFGERLNVQFRAETYNTFNHRNFSIGLPSNNGALDSNTNPNPFAGGLVLITAPGSFLNFHQFTGGNRTMQLGLKLIF